MLKNGHKRIFKTSFMKRLICFTLTAYLIFGDSGFLTTVFALESSENSIDIKTEGQNILSKVPTDISDVPEVPTKSPVESETPKVTETPEVTETPKVTETPEVTETPKVTETPEVTETPKAPETDKPASDDKSEVMEKSIADIEVLDNKGNSLISFNRDVLTYEISIPSSTLNINIEYVIQEGINQTVHNIVADNLQMGKNEIIIYEDENIGTYKLIINIYDESSDENTLDKNTEDILASTDYLNNVQPIEIKDKDDHNGTFKIQYRINDKTEKLSQLKAAVWSEANGQDDLKWYTLTNEGDVWETYVDSADHGYDQGNYFIHLYVVDNEGVSTCINTTSVDILRDDNELSLSVWANDKQSHIAARLESRFFDKDIEEVEFAVWSDVNGQDDLKWYNAVQKSENDWEAVFAVADHKSSIGNYQVHAYTKNKSGEMKCVSTGKVTISGITSSGIKITDQNDKNGTFRVEVGNITSPADLTSVRVAVWSEINGQDDLKWYNLKKNDSGWFADIDSGNHGYDQGNYQVHLYAEDSRNINVCLDTKTVTIHSENSSVNMTVWTNDTQSHIAARLQNAFFDRDIVNVKFAVWSEVNGQDDLKWYDATKASNSSWEAVFAVADHKGSVGKYQIHAYTVSKSGIMKCIQTGNIVINGLSGGSIRIAEQDNVKGTFRVWADNIKSPSKIISATVAVWSEVNGQDDLRWYSMKKSGDSWYVDIDSGNHGFDKGNYQVHLYANDSRNVSQCLDTKTVKVSSSTDNLKMKVWTDDSQAYIAARIENARFDRNITDVQFAVWSEVNGQDDLKWYSGKKVNDSTWEGVFAVAAHLGSTGVYQVHAYTVDKKGMKQCISTSSVYIGGIYATSAREIENDSYKGQAKLALGGLTSPARITNVSAAVWSENNGQDDLRWYSPTLINGEWIVMVDAYYHGYVKGNYKVHYYATDERGVTQLVADMTVGISVSQDYLNANALWGIDVSRHQKEINWGAVRSSGVDFAMIRSGYGKDSGQEDPYFRQNIMQARANGIRVGVYHYSYADSVERARAEAEYCLSIIRPYGGLDFPVAFDFEESSRKKKELRDENTDIVIAFCTVLRNAGYKTSLYSGANMLNNYIDCNRVRDNGIDLWVAHYGVSEPRINYPYEMWQYTSSGKIAGIDGNVDLNYSYKKY